MLDPYQDFADRYDRFFGPLGEYPPAEVAFYRTLFDRYRIRRVLDCACGTGRHLPLFHQLGAKVVGSDLSPAMLAKARVNLSTLNLDIPLYRVDFRQLSLQFERPFDAVLCINSSIQHMPDDVETLRAFKSMRSVLREGGVLVLTQGTTDRQWREKPRFILETNNPDFTRLFVIDYVGQGARYHVLDIEHTNESNRLDVWRIDYPRMMLMADQKRLLEEASFQHVDAFGDYEGTPYDEERSKRLILVAN